MIPHFKAHTHIQSDKQHFDTKQASMIAQEKEPLSPLKKKGCKSLVICTLLLYPPSGEYHSNQPYHPKKLFYHSSSFPSNE